MPGATKKKKSVSFHESVKVRLAIHIDDYTDTEIDACWYSPEEFHAICTDIQATVNRLQDVEAATEYDDKQVKNTMLQQQQQQQDDNSNEFCRRGVECKTQKSKLRRQRIRMAGWYAVFSEQDLLEEEIYQDPSFDADEFIARAYSVASASALSIARATALRDQSEVEEVTKDFLQ